MVAKNKPTEHDIGTCSCDKKERPWKEHIQHLKDEHLVHGGTQYSQRMVLHIDADDHIMSEYEYNGPVDFARSTLMLRRKRW